MSTVAVGCPAIVVERPYGPFARGSGRLFIAPIASIEEHGPKPRVPFPSLPPALRKQFAIAFEKRNRRVDHDGEENPLLDGNAGRVVIKNDHRNRGDREQEKVIEHGVDSPDWKRKTANEFPDEPSLG